MAEKVPQNRIPELDGLRGLAILSVWVGHYFSIPAQGKVAFLDGYWFRLGWTGVDLFFVLSGFLIGGILLDVRESPSYFRTFYARRFFRIIPLYYLWIVAYIFLAVFLAHPVTSHIGTMESPNRSILSHFLFLQNFSAALPTVVAFWWLNATWSLAVEEQFYLVCPLLVRYLNRRALTVLLIGVTLAAPLLRLIVRISFQSGPWLAYRLMPCRADSLALGMLAAVYWTSTDHREWLASHAAIAYGFFGVLGAGVAVIWRWYSDPTLLLTQTLGYTWLALFFAAVLILALSRPAAPIAFLARFRLLRDLGGVSYCVYIIHPAIFLLCHRLLLHSLPSVTNGKVAAVTALATLITYFIAKLSWKVFEAPLVRRGHAYTYWPADPTLLRRAHTASQVKVEL